jgi:RNase P subunit RPR2
MSAKIRHCPRCKSRDITVFEAETDMQLSGAKVANVYCRSCGNRSRVILRMSKPRSGGIR